MKTASETVGVPDREHFAPGEGTPSRCATCRYWRHVSRGEGECQIMRPLNGTLGRMITRREDGCNDYETRPAPGVDELAQITAEEKQREARRRAHIALRIRVARTAAQLQRKTVAEALGLHLETYGAFEKGRFLPRAKHVQRMALLFGVSTDWLVTDAPIRLEGP